ncbi:myb-binding protein 1A isoform X2 [Cloeon dipterum]
MSRDPALDAFPRLSSADSKVRLAAAETLLQYFFRLRKDGQEEEVSNVGRRLVRGLACSKSSARKGYYLTFTGFLKTFTDLPYSSICEFAQKELKVSSGGSKGEEGDLLLGKILFAGALLRSGRLQTFSDEEKGQVVEGLVGAMSKRSYLPLIAAPFLECLLEESPDDDFHRLFWPALRPYLVKDWSQQTQSSLYILLHIYKKFKVKKTELKGILGLDLVAKANWPHLAKILLEGQHPVTDLLVSRLPADQRVEFWNGPVQEVLGKASRARHAAALNLLSSLFKTSDEQNFPNLLNSTSVSLLKKSLQDGELRADAADAMEALLDRVKTVPDKVRAKVLEKLTADEFSFDEVTKCGLLRAVANSLQKEGIKVAIDNLKKVVVDDSKKTKDKCGAVHMIATLASSTAAAVESRETATLFLLEQAFFSGSNTSALNQAAKQNFLRCQKVAQDSVLRAAFDYVDGQLKKKRPPVKMSTTSVSAWKKMATQVSELDAARGKVEAVLSQLMVHVGLQLLNDPDQALEALEELHECCSRVLGGKQDKHWVEVVVEVLLSLLAHPQAALRATIRKMFSALCPTITQEALTSLVEACSAQDNPLVPKDQAEEDDSEVEEEDDEEGEEAEEEGNEDEDEEVEDDDDEDDGDDQEDTQADKIRAAVRSALGTNGEVSDAESVDVDDISEEEGRRLDEALSQAFKGARKGLSKRDSKVQEQMLHFRLRVLDLLETYVRSEQSLSLTLQLVEPLLDLLARCLRDTQMRPLEGRLKHLLCSFGQLRKFADIKGVSESNLAESLNALLERGRTSQAVFLSVAAEAAAVAAFLARASQSVESSGPLTDAFKAAMSEFFCVRDCALPAAFFTPLLKTSWSGNLSLLPLLMEYAFDGTEETKIFRRPVAITFLLELVSNQQLMQTNKLKSSKLLGQMAIKASAALTSKEQKERFERQLLTLIQKLIPRLDEKQKKPLTADLEGYIPQVTLAGKETKKLFRRVALQLKVPEEKLKLLTQVNGKIENGKASAEEVIPKDKKTKKKEKKQAKKRAKNQEKVAKVAAKKLRLEASSQGLQSVSFGSVNLNKCVE